jgi:hypothetical protein
MPPFSFCYPTEGGDPGSSGVSSRTITLGALPMYSTCIYCYRPLGRNEAVETFQVGRRLAFDGERGRLWVVCPACERWNLSPLEERWEAIEACERHFRSTKMRVSTEHIGLARTREGLDLVRIGRPRRPEFAGWRYGDQFGRRRRRRMVQAGVAVGVGAATLAGGWILGLSLGGAGWAGYTLAEWAQYPSDREVIAVVPVYGKDPVKVTRRYLDQVQLGHDADSNEWRLLFREGRTQYEIEGDGAVRAAGQILPHINLHGAPKRAVQRAVHLLEELRDPADIFARVAESGHMVRTRSTLQARAFLTTQPSVTRLAMEMAAHEESERRALEGELAVLERAWREAEEIAAIADRLLIPATVEGALQRLRGWRG